VIYLAHYGAKSTESDEMSRRAFRGEPAELRSPRGIVEAALMLRGRGIIQLGLLLLVATPVARVFFSALAFVWERDYLYVVLTLVVLVVLLFSLFLGQLKEQGLETPEPDNVGGVSSVQHF
jgi:hypothetical protein